MNRQEASLYFRLRVVPCSPVPPNKAMQTDGRFATAADRQGVRCQPTTPMETLPTDLQDRITKHLRDWSVQAEHLVKTDTSVLVFGHRGSQPVVLKVLCTPEMNGDLGRSWPPSRDVLLSESTRTRMGPSFWNSYALAPSSPNQLSPARMTARSTP